MYMYMYITLYTAYTFTNMYTCMLYMFIRAALQQEVKTHYVINGQQEEMIKMLKCNIQR